MGFGFQQPPPPPPRRRVDQMASTPGQPQPQPGTGGGGSSGPQTASMQPGSSVPGHQMSQATKVRVNQGGMNQLGNVGNTIGVGQGTLAQTGQSQDPVEDLKNNPTPPAVAGGLPTNPQDMWQSILNDYNQGWGRTEGVAQQQGVIDRRRAAEADPRAMQGGRGGIAASSIAEGNTRAQMRLAEARQGHEQRGLEMKMSWLNMMMNSDEAQKNRDLQEKLQSMAQETQLSLAQLGQEIPDPNQDYSEINAQNEQQMFQELSKQDGLGGQIANAAGIPWAEWQQMSAIDREAKLNNYNRGDYS